MKRILLALVGLALVAEPGCSTSVPTSMLIVVESPDLVVPTDLDGLHIAVDGADSAGMGIDEAFALSTPLPATYRVYPAPGHESESVTVTVGGLLGGAQRIERVVPAAFLQGAEIVVRVILARPCYGIICPRGIDCELGRCVTTMLDAGPVEVGPRDVGPMDAGCGGGCDDSVPCTRDSCVMGVCAHMPDDGLCPTGQVCNVPGGCGDACATAADCDDMLPCNGTELCTSRRCMPGPALDCDDSVSCTTDACDDAAGGCTHTADDMACDNGDPCDGAETCDVTLDCQPPLGPLDCNDSNACTDEACLPTGCDYQTADLDMDGHGDSTCPPIGVVAADDCDEMNATVYTGATEACNGIDDNCNGMVDETSTCAAGSTGTCTTSCGSMGTRVCSAACGWSVCSAPAEICNGVDDDCNGAADELFGCVQGAVVSCTTSCGSTGTRTCDGGCVQGACIEPVEICGNTIDEDCDGLANGCVECETSVDCDDLLPCNGVETCVPGRSGNFCQNGPPLVCDDGVRCTVDACDDAAGGCVAPPDDRFCANTNFCDGDETCLPVVGCQPGVAPTCIDGSACTDEACVGTSPGMCVLTTHDLDSDGHGEPTCTAVGGIPADDCNDTDADIYPGAPELCNGIDDDCAAGCDDRFACCRGSTGSCTTTCGTTGSRICSGTCSWGICSPPPEVCNGIDDDCNTACDDGFSCCAGSTGSCTTSCGTTGSRTCDASCGWGACIPPVEICNGIDDDCNGLVDGLFECVAGSTGACTTSCGTGGTRMCSASCGWGACNPPAEVCNGADDDCNAACDDGFACCRGSMSTCTTSCGTTGSRLCGASCTWAACVPPAEVCNGVDDDCSGAPDETFACVQGATGSCTASCGTTGSRVCSASCAWGSCTPPVEVCNGNDDDCDGAPDNGFTCAVGATRSCRTSCEPMGSSTGTQTCNGSCGWGACVPPAETCNGLDDDCDGTTDDGFTCASGASGSCTSSCGTTGSRICNAACGWGSCTAPSEICNGIDDDCDTVVDDTFTCPSGSTGSCTASCGTTGSRVCSASCAWGACAPPAEACNGIDDDCNTTCDDGFACCRGSSSSCTTTCGSTGSRLCGASCTWAACVPPAEACNGLDDDCNGQPDETFTCVAGGTGACTASCGTTGSRVCSAACAWGACTPPVEVCNGADDDCDTLPDDGFTCARGAVGSCMTSCGTTGSRTCGASCTWGVCVPPPEACNGIDDDCNMIIDDSLQCVSGSSGSCTTTCGSTGSRSCGAMCTWSACAPPAETCNGLDDDCDSSVDDGFTCASGSTGACTASCGTIGTRMCSAACAWGACAPPVEICNAIDDDCDTMVDDGFACPQGSAGSCTASCGSTGSRICGATCTWGACNAPVEICNGADDDCDTLIDDGFTCAAGATSSCLASCGTTGSRTCTAACAWGACAPPAEVCNGTDDDCDGLPDDGFTCAVGSIGSCTASCGTTGSRTCGAACTYGACNPPAEVCNGTDDDCDTMPDDGFACVLGATGSCTTSCGTTGTRSCGAGCVWGACTPPAETCNGVDDDCDAVIDDGFTCAQSSTGSCTASCGSTGSRTCSAACAWGACVPPAETCNGADDDCVSGCDNGFACCRGATGSCVASCGTTGSRTCSAACGWGACAPPVEACNGIDDDCDTVVDDGFLCPAGSSGSCLASCGSTGSRVCSAACAWGACSPPAEVCNGADDDCDGLLDDGFTCIAGASGSCTASCGTTGSRLCSAACAWGACSPPTEICNGIDDDCDTVIDDGYACIPGATSSCTSACGTTGTRSCSASCTWNPCVPPAETCNGADDDCNAVIDNGFTCAQSSSGSCTASCGTTGTRMCSAACAWGACAPPAETCNAIDDDCDTICDDGFACCSGAVGSCTTGCGSTGSRLCSGTCAWGSCNPPAETCNGLDDDCASGCDNGFACCAGSSGSCTTSCGSTGSRTCSAACAWNTCTAPAETCNGIDDDCVSGCDNGFTCCVGATQACTASCGAPGTQTCSGSCGWGTCNPPASEAGNCSNGIDDDCDTLIDAADTVDCSTGTCPGATTISAPGGRYTSALTPHVYTGTCGGAGAEAYFTFTIGVTSDVFLATHQTVGINTVLYVRLGACATGTQVGCNTDADGVATGTSRLTLTNLAPGTYNVFVDTVSGVMSGMVTLDAYITTPGTESDRCGNPTVLTAGTGSIAGSTCAFGRDYTPVTDNVTCFPFNGTYGPSGSGEDRVYAFYLSSARAVTFSGCGGTTAYDTTAWIRSVCTDAGMAAQPVCDDDACAGQTTFCNSAGLRSTVTTTIGPGLYYFFADGYGAPCPSCGNFTYAITGL